MKKITKLLVLGVVGFLLLPVAAPAQDITVCYKGESISLSEENAARFFELGAKRGECPDTDSEEKAEKGPQRGDTTSGKDGKESKEQAQEREQDREQEKQKDGQAGTSKVTICHKGTHSITISESALQAHLKHGDSQGSCAGNAPQSQQRVGQSAQQFGGGANSEDARTSGAESEKKQKSGDKSGNSQGKKDKGKTSK